MKIMNDTISRRNAIKKTVLGVSTLSLTSQAVGAADDGIPKRRLGKTDEMVSMLAVGGHHVGRIKDEKESIRFMRTAIDEGVTFFDNAWHYHDGYAEEIMGKALQDGYRKRVFLMTKHHGRDKKTALEHLDINLRRLKTDYLDLWQYHEIINPEDPAKILPQAVVSKLHMKH